MLQENRMLEINFLHQQIVENNTKKTHNLGKKQMFESKWFFFLVMYKTKDEADIKEVEGHELLEFFFK